MTTTPMPTQAERLLVSIPKIVADLRHEFARADHANDDVAMDAEEFDVWAETFAVFSEVAANRLTAAAKVIASLTAANADLAAQIETADAAKERLRVALDHVMTETFIVTTEGQGIQQADGTVMRFGSPAVIVGERTWHAAMVALSEYFYPAPVSDVIE